LVTSDGELLGTSTAQSPNVKDPESFGALVTDVANEYCRLGEEYAAVDAVQRSRSHMHCLLVEMSAGLVGVSSCVGCDCFVIALAAHDAPPGLVKARLQALAAHVQDAFSAVS
jgi:hypothetical protein